jgi:hypothetical protein
LATKLDAEPHLNGGYASSISGFGSSFLNMQQAFNTIVSRLNADTGISSPTFLLSMGTTNIEESVVSTDPINLIINFTYAQNWIQGNIVLYKAISTFVSWAPVSFGDPAILKRVREGTFIFANKAFTSAAVSYSSDLSTGPVVIPFSAEGVGFWGSFHWGQDVIWGGGGTLTPLRTLIPPFKQRCRYMSSQYTHSIAREPYLLYGFSYAYEMISTRGYR